jgi:hypothetical protein
LTQQIKNLNNLNNDAPLPTAEVDQPRPQTAQVKKSMAQQMIEEDIKTGIVRNISNSRKSQKVLQS